ncbi:hypothetical protein C8R48DRAFT_774550 [Suillus tomentosus]|nr:hypothetical protein C8R48DRAFT_774550 [Suillus tomentosus]
MRTREEVGITVEAARNLEAFFAWTPPLSTEPRDADDLLAGLVLSDDVAAGFAALKELKKTEEVEQGIIPQAILDDQSFPIPPVVTGVVLPART